MPRHSLDDPGYRQFAWGRYWRVMRWMTLVAALAVPVALAWIAWAGGELELHMGISVGLSVFFSLVLGAALMGLVFLSSGTGHDEAVIEPFDKEHR